LLPGMQQIYTLSANEHHDWVFPFLLGMWQKLRTQMFCIKVCPNILGRLSHICHQGWSWWSQWGVVKGCHCYSWSRGWSGTLWVMLIKLRLHSYSCYLYCVVVEFLCNLSIWWRSPFCTHHHYSQWFWVEEVGTHSHWMIWRLETAV